MIRTAVSIAIALAPPFSVGSETWLPSRVAFGSCAKQHREQPVWNQILAREADLFIFTGDNVYADTHDPEQLRAAYGVLGAKPGFKALREKIPLLATWDDHDYGLNDEGVENPSKKEAQKIFLDFFGVPESSPRRSREGVYHASTFEAAGRCLQVITLDTRYFRSPMKAGKKQRYLPDSDPAKTVLGSAQWRWLEEQLRVPADLRIVVSSIQVIPNQHRSEKWGYFPLEKQRLFDLIRSTGANGVILVSGDRHKAEFSVHDSAVGYPLLEVTSSGLTHAGISREEENRHRVSGVYGEPNFGMITIDWKAEPPTVTSAICDVASGEAVATHRATTADLKPGS